MYVWISLKLKYNLVSFAVSLIRHVRYEAERGKLRASGTLLEEIRKNFVQAFQVRKLSCEPISGIQETHCITGRGYSILKMSRPAVPRIEYEDYTESASDKLKRKALADPYVPIGILGFCGALAWGAYTYKSRGNTSTSIFLMRLRVVAQTCVVGAMALGAGVTMLKSYSSEKKT